MALQPTQQIKKLIENSRHILVVFDAEKEIDNICAALAWKIFLEKQGKQVDAAGENFSTPQNLKFIKETKDIKPSISHSQKFTIKLDISEVKIDTLSYDIKGDTLSIHINPSQGIITKNELRTAQSNFKYDLIISLGARDLESLGDIFFNNTDLFYRLPIINIDTHPGNEHYGQINAVSLSRSCGCEHSFQIMRGIDETLLDAKTAEILLTGLISRTKSFRSGGITPETLNIAGHLIGMGADRKKIIKNLYYNHSLDSLKIWGKALSRLQADPEKGLVWTVISREDFSLSGSREDALPELVDNLIANSPEAKAVILIYEKINEDGKVNASVFSFDHRFDSLELTRGLNATGNKKRAVISLTETTLKEAEIKIIGMIKKNLKDSN